MLSFEERTICLYQGTNEEKLVTYLKKNGFIVTKSEWQDIVKTSDNTPVCKALIINVAGLNILLDDLMERLGLTLINSLDGEIWA